MGGRERTNVVNQRERERERNRWQRGESCWAQRGGWKAKKCQQKKGRGGGRGDGGERTVSTFHLRGRDSLTGIYARTQTTNEEVNDHVNEAPASGGGQDVQNQTKPSKNEGGQLMGHRHGRLLPPGRDNQTVRSSDPAPSLL